MQSSLIVTTYDWPAALDLVLESALRQTHPPGEVLVADDGSDERTAIVVRAFLDRFRGRGVEMHHVWHPDRGFRAAEIRNRALAMAQGEYILLVDGDCILHPGFTRSHLAFARAGTLVQGTRVLLSERRSARALSTRQTTFHPFQRGIAHRVNAVSASWLSGLVPSPRDPLSGVRSCNMGFWRSDAALVNGFDERFVGWGREDSDFVARMTRAAVRRRKLKFGGIVYHLWHAERPRDALKVNDELFAHARRRGGSRAAEGMDKYQTGFTDAMTPDYFP
ncbi:MAG: glycosyltransferase family 2 protein [Gemmatimonadota bacterium]|nr:glycosyltransferase family 2 protein [Gemmatimonadota bacterium]